MPDKYTATWVSYSSISDFLRCPRSYYLKNVYKDPKTKRKISIVTPAMSLGIAVHEVLEGLGDFPSESRMNKDLIAWFNEVWEKYKGLKGGFLTDTEEAEYKQRGLTMLNNVQQNPLFLVNKRVKLPKAEMNPNFYLNEEENIILNGLIDWIEFLPETDSLHIIDFKTGKYEESEGSLQLPIYLLLCNALQKRKVTKASYWYLETGKIIEKELPDSDDAYRIVMEAAIRVKRARDAKEFICKNGDSGCSACIPFEKIINNDSSALYVGIGPFNQDLYVVR